jgi:hypothetical protein
MKGSLVGGISSSNKTPQSVLMNIRGSAVNIPSRENVAMTNLGPFPGDANNLVAKPGFLDGAQAKELNEDVARETGTKTIASTSLPKSAVPNFTGNVLNPTRC